MADYLRIGRVIKPQGIKGELKIEPLTDGQDRFHSLKSVFVENHGSYLPCNVAAARVHEGFAYLLLDRIADRNAAETLRGSFLCVAREDAVTLPEDTYFIDDLIGCSVYSNEGGSIGKVQEIIKTGANDVFSIATNRGELLVPVIKKVVVAVEPDQKRITLDGKALKEVADFAD